jgi:hypothetical protein
MVHNEQEGKDYCTGFAFEGELSNVTYTINGQGRTEIRRNVLPEYAHSCMCSIYRIAIYKTRKMI